MFIKIYFGPEQNYATKHLKYINISHFCLHNQYFDLNENTKKHTTKNKTSAGNFHIHSLLKQTST